MNSFKMGFINKFPNCIMENMKHAYDMYFKLKLNFVFILLTFNTTYLYNNEVS